MVLPNGHMGQLYYGKKIRDKEDFSYLLELAPRDMASYLYENDRTFSLGHIKLEYGTYGSGDYRHPAVEILQNDGSTYSDFQFTGYQVTSGKPKLPGLPATYTEQDGEAETLIITLKDTHTNLELHLLYTIFVEGGVIARSASISNQGDISVQVQTAMSLCLDLPDQHPHRAHRHPLRLPHHAGFHGSAPPLRLDGLFPVRPEPRFLFQRP